MSHASSSSASSLRCHLLLKRAFQDLLEGRHIREVIKGNTEGHHVFTKAAKLALHKLSLSCRCALWSASSTTTQKAVHRAFQHQLDVSAPYNHLGLI